MSVARHRPAGACLAQPADLLDRQPASWLVIQIPAKQLKKTLQQLDGAGIARCHFVEHRDTHRPGKGWRRCDVALLGGYVFVADCHRDDLFSVCQPLQVLNVSEADELTLQLRQLREALSASPGPLVVKPYITEGTEVSVETGTFAGQRGRVVSREGSCDLVVDLPILGMSVSVRMPAEWVDEVEG